MLLLLASLAQAQSLECAALDPVAQRLCDEALSHEASGRFNKAAATWKLVHERDPEFDRATLGLAHARAEQGYAREAEALYRELGMHADAMEALAELIEDERPREAMALYVQLQSLRLGERRFYLDEGRAALKAEQPTDSLAALERFLELEGADEDPEGAATLMIQLAASAEPEQREQARELLQRAAILAPEGSALQEQARARLDRMAVEDSASVLAVGGGEALDPSQKQALERVRSLMADGRLDRADAELQALLEQAPRSPDAWGSAGDLALNRGELAAAETAWLTAIALEPEEATWHVRYGRLLAKGYGGRRHAEAESELERALTLRPSWAQLHMDLAELRRQQGDFAGALQSCQRYLEVDAQGVDQAAAERCVADLTRQRPPPPQLEQLIARPPAGIPEAAWEAFKRAKVYLEDRDDDSAARTEVEQALELAPDYVDALNLLAHLQLREMEPQAARETWERSLQVRPDQPQIVLALGDALQEQGDVQGAAARYRQAADLGAEDAWFALAAQAVAAGDWMEGRRLLERYFSQASSGRRHSEALELREELERRYRLRVGGLVAGGVVLVSLPTALLLRRRSGKTLRELLDAHPEAYRDSAEILAAIRHEVLKHNTTVLPAAAEALEDGRDEPVFEAFDHLLGRGGREGITARFWSYVAELEALGRRYDERLNLRVRDHIFAPMIAAFQELEQVGERLSPGRIPADRRRLCERLEALSTALNQDAYQALGRLIREVCVLRLDRPLLEGCWARVLQEPAITEGPTPRFTLELESSELAVRVFRREMEDLVTNLLRNATQVAVAERQDEAAVALFVEEEFDPITGLERVVLRVADNAVSPLSDEMIRGRYIARGLGLVVELVRRNSGQIRVEAQADYSKAIVVRLPRAELPAETVWVEEES
ncbi:MAG: tetratricopeptide repeat protein [Myxococcota bacterium]|nr:tetratricopeptide repeat protein [Myxococcota bacterium]